MFTSFNYWCLNFHKHLINSIKCKLEEGWVKERLKKDLNKLNFFKDFNISSITVFLLRNLR